MQAKKFQRFQSPAVLVVLFVMGTIALHAQTYTVLYNFATTSCDPVNPSNAGIIAQGRDGDLYSSTPAGGCPVNGAVFKVTPNGKMTVLHSFSGGTDGYGPFSGLTLALNGDFWGTTEGEDFNAGSIFKVTTAGKETNYSTLLGGSNGANGGQPFAPPVLGFDGNLYGTTSADGIRTKCTYGDSGCGVIYRITPSGSFKVLYTFDQTNGANPYDPLFLGNDGNFYGAASVGGSVGNSFKNAGVIFRVTPEGKYKVLYVFCSVSQCYDGANPIGGVIQGTDGNFYGATSSGGTHLYSNYFSGVVFKLTPSGKLTVLYNFCNVQSCADGGTPIGGLVQGTDGNFYGTTSSGGSGYGTIFQITPKGKYTVLYTFSLATGGIPKTTLVQNTNGILYGDTVAGGSGNKINCGGNRCGVFYSLDAGLKPYAGLVNWWGAVGDTIEILGQGLKETTAVSFNGTPATYTIVSDTYLTAVVPSGVTGGFVTVTTSSGTLTSNRKFRVLPGIQSFSPTSGPVGTPVTINGSNFTGATKVTFGGVSATTFKVVSDIEITANVPTGAKTGKIQVTAPLGTATSATNFTVTQ